MDGAEASRLARHANNLLIAAYPMPVAPKSLPDLARGAARTRRNVHRATAKRDVVTGRWRHTGTPSPLHSAIPIAPASEV